MLMIGGKKFTAISPRVLLPGSAFHMREEPDLRHLPALSSSSAVYICLETFLESTAVRPTPVILT